VLAPISAARLGERLVVQARGVGPGQGYWTYRSVARSVGGL